MNRALESPWDFPNEYLSSNGKYKLEFKDVYEVAMGVPLSGKCFLEFDDNIFKLNALFGGPIVWDENSEKAAAPYWTKNRSQKLAIIDAGQMKIWISKMDFRVIALDRFENGVVYGIDSPIYRTKEIIFDTLVDEYVKTIEIR